MGAGASSLNKSTMKKDSKGKKYDKKSTASDGLCVDPHHRNLEREKQEAERKTEQSVEKLREAVRKLNAAKEEITRLQAKVDKLMEDKQAMDRELEYTNVMLHKKEKVEKGQLIGARQALENRLRETEELLGERDETIRKLQLRFERAKEETDTIRRQLAKRVIVDVAEKNKLQEHVREIEDSLSRVTKKWQTAGRKLGKAAMAVKGMQKSSSPTLSASQSEMGDAAASPFVLPANRRDKNMPGSPSVERGTKTTTAVAELDGKLQRKDELSFEIVLGTEDVRALMNAAAEQCVLSSVEESSENDGRDGRRRSIRRNSISANERARRVSRRQLAPAEEVEGSRRTSLRRGSESVEVVKQTGALMEWDTRDLVWRGEMDKYILQKQSHCSPLLLSEDTSQTTVRPSEGTDERVGTATLRPITAAECFQSICSLTVSPLRESSVLFVEGSAGGGKSTGLYHMALAMAEQWEKSTLLPFHYSFEGCAEASSLRSLITTLLQDMVQELCSFDDESVNRSLTIPDDFDGLFTVFLETMTTARSTGSKFSTLLSEKRHEDQVIVIFVDGIECACEEDGHGVSSLQWLPDAHLLARRVHFVIALDSATKKNSALRKGVKDYKKRQNRTPCTIMYPELSEVERIRLLQYSLDDRALLIIDEYLRDKERAREDQKARERSKYVVRRAGVARGIGDRGADDEEDGFRSPLTVLTEKLEAGSPLFLTFAAREFLRLLRAVDGMDTDLVQLAEEIPETTEELVNNLCVRLEDAHGRSFTQCVLLLLSVCREGIPSVELVLMLKTLDPATIGKAVTEDAVEAFLIDFEVLLGRQAEQIKTLDIQHHLKTVRRSISDLVFKFFHRSLATIAQKRYFFAVNFWHREPESLLNVHRFIAQFFLLRLNADHLSAKSESLAEGYFDGKGSYRCFRDLCYHLIKGKLWNTLETTLSSLHYVQRKFQNGLSGSLLDDYTGALLANGLPKALMLVEQPFGPRGKVTQFFFFVQKVYRLLVAEPSRTLSLAVNEPLGSTLASTARTVIASMPFAFTWIQRENRPHSQGLLLLGPPDLKGHSGWIGGADFDEGDIFGTRKGKQARLSLPPSIISVAGDGYLRVWDSVSGQQLAQIFVSNTLNALALSSVVQRTGSHRAVFCCSNGNMGCLHRDVPISASEDSMQTGETQERLDNVPTSEENIESNIADINDHPYEINAACFLGGGLREQWNTGEGLVVVASADGSIRVYDIVAAEELDRERKLRERGDRSSTFSAGWSTQTRTSFVGMPLRHSARATSVTFCQCTSEIVASFADGSVFVSPWLQRGRKEEKARLLGKHRARVTCVSSSELQIDGARTGIGIVLSSSADGRLMLWDISEQAALLCEKEAIERSSENIPEELTCCALTLGCSFAASGTRTGALSLWRITPPGAKMEAGSRVTTEWTFLHLMFLEPFSSLVTSLRFSFDGSFLVGGSADGSLRLWNAALAFETHADNDAVEGGVSNDVGRRDRSAHTESERDRVAATALAGELGHRGKIAAVSACNYAPNGQEIASVLADGSLKVFSSVSGAPIVTVPQAHTGQATGLAYSPSMELLVTVSKTDSMVRVWDSLTALEVKEKSQPMETTSATVFTNDGKKLVLGGPQGELNVVDVSSWVTVRTIEGHKDEITCLAAPSSSATGLSFVSRVFSGSMDCLACAWDVEEGERIALFEGHTAEILDLCLNREASMLLTASRDGTIRLWDSEQGKALRSLALEGPRLPILSFALIAEERYVLYVTNAGILYAHDLSDDKCVTSYMTNMAELPLTTVRASPSMPSAFIAVDLKGNIHVLTLRVS